MRSKEEIMEEIIAQDYTKRKEVLIEVLIDIRDSLTNLTVIMGNWANIRKS